MVKKHNFTHACTAFLVCLLLTLVGAGTLPVNAQDGEPIVLTTPTVIIEGPYGLEEEAEQESYEDEITEQEPYEEEITEQESYEEEITEFIDELLSLYEARNVEEFEDLVSMDYREKRRSDEGTEALDYDALLYMVRHEAEVVDALRIRHTVHGIRQRGKNIRVPIRWDIRFKRTDSKRSMQRRGITELLLTGQGQLRLIGQRRDALFGIITSDSEEGEITTVKPTVPKQNKRPKLKRDKRRGT